MDKAGAYGIQGHGALLVEAIQGDYYAVVGLPLVRLAGRLARFGGDPWGGSGPLSDNPSGPKTQG